MTKVIISDGKTKIEFNPQPLLHITIGDSTLSIAPAKLLNDYKKRGEEATSKAEVNLSTDHLTVLKDLLLVHLNNDPLRDYLQQLDPKIDELIRSLKSQ